MSTSKRKKAWYRRFKEEYLKATAYILAFDAWRNQPEKEIYHDFEKLTLTRFIFESNNFEREGLPRVDTRELIIEEFEKFPELEKLFLQNLSIQLGLVFDEETLEKFISDKGYQLEPSEVPLIAKYKSKSKEAVTVAKHLLAAMVADGLATQGLYERKLNSYFKVISKQAAESESVLDRQSAKGILIEHFVDYPKEVSLLLTEENLREIHESMAEGLIEEKYEPAGKYRKHSVITDLDSSFPSPCSIKGAMERFFYKSNELEKRDYIDPILFSIWVKTNLILIHPYSDFNGRMSRLLMNMVLRSNQVPFWVALRSNKRDRHRYMTAIRHYRRGKKASMATLISIHLNQGFDEFNNLLEISNLPTIPFRGPYEELCKACSTMDDMTLFNRLWSNIEE